jgi:hypothetical protein
MSLTQMKIEGYGNCIDKAGNRRSDFIQYCYKQHILNFHIKSSKYDMHIDIEYVNGYSLVEKFPCCGLPKGQETT